MAQQNYWSNKTPFSIFVDPAYYLGFVGDRIHRYVDGATEDPDDPDGSLSQPYIERLQRVCSFYTYVSDYGDIRNENGSYYTGWTGFTEFYARIPPEDRRNIMLNIQEYWTLEAMYSPNFYSTGVSDGGIAGGLTFGYSRDFPYYDTGNASGITYPAVPESWKTDPQIISEFARQSAMGVPYLAGGITPSTPGITMGVFKAVAKRFWNDQAAYVKSRGTENVIQYSDFGTPQMSFAIVPKIGLRSENATGDRSWWRRGFYYPDLYDDVNYSKEKGVLRDLADGSLSADMYGGSVYNWFPNIGEEISYAWQITGTERLVYVSPGVSGVAARDYALDDLSYWASKGPAALMHEYYKYTDELAANTSTPAYRKGLAMIVQLDSPVIPEQNRIGGGVYAATKFGYMKDLGLAADIDIFGAFGATDANVPNMRKPDQIWVWSSNWYNNKLLFESGTGNAADVSLFGWDELTTRFGIYTARSQVEKLLFKRPMMTEDEANLLAGSDGYFLDPTTEQQEERLQWLEENTLPNVYWDSRIGEQYTQGASNNIRFWSGATGNCLPAPCVFDRTSPIAAYLNMNNDIFKNDVRVAYKKWISETHTSAIEKAYSRLREIGFTPTVQKKKPTLFVDPNLQLGWLPYDSGFSGAAANEFRNRMLKVATPYTYISSGPGVFFPPNAYLAQRQYFDAEYGLSSNVEIQIATHTNPIYQVLPNGYQGGYYLPPISSRAVMFNSEYPWLNLFGYPVSDDYCCGNAASYDEDRFGFFIDNRGASAVIEEFARQAAMGSSVASYLFPEGHPVGGLTPGSAQTTLGVMRRVGEKHWNDLSDYALTKDGAYSPSPKARHVIHYAGAPGFPKYGTLISGVRRQANTTRRSYWQRNQYLFDFADVYDGGETSFDMTKSMHDAQELASGLAVSLYNTFPSAPEWAAGATHWFTDFSIGNRKSPTGEALSSDYSFSDSLYWQTKEHASIIGQFDRAIRQYGIADESNPPKFDAVVTPVFSYEGGEITEVLWNAWSGGRKDPRLAAAIDAASLFAQRDETNPVMRSPDSVWVWDAPHQYWLAIPTRSTYSPPNRNDGEVGVAPTEWPNYNLYWEKRGTTSQPNLNGGTTGHTMWARNYLEKLLFGRPEYPNELLQLMQSDGISSGGAGDPSNINQFRGDIQARTGKWIFDNSLTDGWWVYSSETYRHAENRIWYDPSNGGSKLPSPCVLDQNSPLAPWLNFSSQIRTTDVVDAMRHYISDYGCQYVESFKDQIDRYFAP